MHLVGYEPVRDPCKPTLKRAIREKMKVLRGFCVVNDENEERIRHALETAVAMEPEHDYELVLDRYARKMITEKLNT